jgi:hypothetical protein
MSLARLKRLQRLESRRPSERPWTDPGPQAIALLKWCITSAEAVRADKACLIPRYGPPRELSPAMASVMQQLDRVAARLAQEACG